MKCPYQKRVVHIPGDTEGFIKYYAEDSTLFGECAKNECPFYYTTCEHETVEHCRRAESETKNENIL